MLFKKKDYKSALKEFLDAQLESREYMILYLNYSGVLFRVGEHLLITMEKILSDQD